MYTCTHTHNSINFDAVVWLCAGKCALSLSREMSQAEQVPEDTPAYLNDEPPATGTFRRTSLLSAITHFI